MYYYGPPGPTPNGVGPNLNQSNQVDNPMDLTNRFINNLNGRLVNMGCQPIQPQQGYINQNPYMNGYNTGYYGGQYQYNNPYQQQMEQQYYYQKQMEERNMQIQMHERFAKHAANYTGISIEEDEATKQPEFTPDQLNDLRQYDLEMRKMFAIGYMCKRNKNIDRKKYIPPKKAQLLQNIYNQKQHDLQIMNPDADLMNFMENGYNVMYDIMSRERRAVEQNLRQLYDQNSYQQLLAMHNNMGFGYNPTDNIVPITIDDMEISLPSHLACNDEYRARKQAFINKILEKTVI